MCRREGGEGRGASVGRDEKREQETKWLSFVFTSEPEVKTRRGPSRKGERARE